MMNFKFLREQPFVTATGVAALVHSTWALGTLFSGQQPTVTSDVIISTGPWFAQTMSLIMWLIPAILIAFSLDVGQIVTSHEIRIGKRSWKRYLTFAVFSIATYYLQWTYISFHMPVLPLSSGISQIAHDFAQGVRDAGVWFIPALLPLSTFLYTFSQDDEQPKVRPEAPKTSVNVTESVTSAIAIVAVAEPRIDEKKEAPKLVEHNPPRPVNGYIVDWDMLRLWDPKYNVWKQYATVQEMGKSIRRLEKVRQHLIEDHE